MKKIGIIGYGWLGERISAFLSVKYSVSATTTTQQKADELVAKGMNVKVVSFPDYQLPEPNIKWNIIEDLDVLIITIPMSGKSCCISSLYNRIQNLSMFMGDFKGQIFLMSSTGVYPDIQKGFVEEDVPVEKVSGERMMKNKYPDINILRLGGLMGDNRLLKNYTISNPDHAVNHIHYIDICEIIDIMIEKQSKGKLYNLTAPIHPSKSKVINTQKEMSENKGELDKKGKTVLSSKLVAELAYVFRYPDPEYFHL